MKFFKGLGSFSRDQLFNAFVFHQRIKINIKIIRAVRHVRHHIPFGRNCGGYIVEIDFFVAMIRQFFSEIDGRFCHSAYGPMLLVYILLPPAVQFFIIQSECAFKSLPSVSAASEFVKNLTYFLFTIGIVNETYERLTAFVNSVKTIVIKIFQFRQAAVYHHIPDIHIRFSIHPEVRFIFSQTFNEP